MTLNTILTAVTECERLQNKSGVYVKNIVLHLRNYVNTTKVSQALFLCAPRMYLKLSKSMVCINLSLL